MVWPVFISLQMARKNLLAIVWNFSWYWIFASLVSYLFAPKIASIVFFSLSGYYLLKAFTNKTEKLSQNKFYSQKNPWGYKIYKSKKDQVNNNPNENKNTKEFSDAEFTDV